MNLKFYWYYSWVYIFVNQIKFSYSENHSFILIDQRQTGKYNVQLSIKDVAIIEIGENEFIDEGSSDSEDYYYDDDTLTIKPWLSSTTKKSTTVSTASSTNKNSSTTTKKSSMTTTTTLPTTLIPLKDETYELMHKNVSQSAENSTFAIPEKYSVNLTDNNNFTLLPPKLSHPVFTNYRPENIPVKIIMEPILIPKLRTAEHRLSFERNKDLVEEPVIRFKSRHSQFPRRATRCHAGNIDKNGNCVSNKRSSITKSSFLEKIFKALKEMSRARDEE